MNLEGFQYKCHIYGVDRDIAARLPIAWPNKEQIGTVLFEAGVPGGPDLARLERDLLAVYPEPETAEADSFFQPFTTQASLRKLMARINSGEKTPGLLQTLEQAVSNQPIFVPDAERKIDIEASLKALEYMMEVGYPPKQIQGIRPLTLSEILASVKENHPLTGRPLEPNSLWLEVPKERRFMVAWYQAHGYLDNQPEHLVRQEAQRKDLRGTMFEEYLPEYQQALQQPEHDSRFPQAKRLFASKPPLSLEYKKPANPYIAQADKVHLLDLKNIHHRRLELLKRQHALMGVNTPPHITLEIEDLEEELRMIEIRLRNLG